MSASRWRLLSLSLLSLTLCGWAWSIVYSAPAPMVDATSAPPTLSVQEARLALIDLLEKRPPEDRWLFGLRDLRDGVPNQTLKCDRQRRTFVFQGGASEWPRTLHGVFEYRAGRCQARATHEEWACLPVGTAHP